MPKNEQDPAGSTQQFRAFQSQGESAPSPRNTGMIIGGAVGLLVVIVVVALIAFGPDRLPEYARQAGRMVRQLRQLARSAQDDLRKELGPEYADLRLADLDPRAMIRKHILEAMDEDEASESAAHTRDVLPPGERPPFDAEAT